MVCIKAQAILTSKGWHDFHMRRSLREAGVNAVSLVAAILKYTTIQNIPFKRSDRQRGRLDKFERNKRIVYEGSLPLTDIDLRKNKSYQELMKLVDKTKNWVFVQMPIRRKMRNRHFILVRKVSVFSARNICSTEKEAKGPYFCWCKMIMSKTEQERRGIK